MSREKAQIPASLNVRYCEWNIISGNANLFTINGYRFDKILMILGEEAIHWIYYQNMPFHRRIEGCDRLSVNYCSCCINTQYVKIIDTVKGCLLRQGADK